MICVPLGLTNQRLLTTALIRIYMSFFLVKNVAVFFNTALLFTRLFPPLYRRLLDTEDELSDIQSDSVPSEVRDWLASTFTRQMGMMLKRTEEKPRFRSIVHAVQAGIFVER